jgi:hypothetical protein
MKEIHAKLCGAHIGSRPLLGSFLDKGFIGQRKLWMQRTWSKYVKFVRSVPETRNNLRL